MKTMFKPFLLSATFLFFLFVQEATSKSLEDAINDANQEELRIHVVLVAGSRGWRNYRHQADVFHAYQVAVSHGVPKSNIVLMAYNDIANNRKNSKKGEVFNNVHGPDVYKNLLVDYTGNHVTAHNFLKVLHGNSKGLAGIGTGRVLMSGPRDHVFIFMSDHGAPGLFCFPAGHFLTAPKFNNALIEMRQKRKFGSMVIYLESCESGSMFTKLPKNILVYANTASNATQSSYSCCYDRSLKAYLGDLYSVTWMKDTESRDIRKESIHTQFEVTKKSVTFSVVSQFGFFPLSFFSVADFQGHVDPKEAKRSQSTNSGAEYNNAANHFEDPSDVVDAREVPIFIEMHKLKEAKSLTEKEEVLRDLNKMLNKRLALIAKTRAIFDSSIEILADFHKPSWEEVHFLKNDDCYYPVLQHVHNQCYDVNENEYALEMLKKYVILCERGVDPSLIHRAIDKHCVGEKITGAV